MGRQLRRAIPLTGAVALAALSASTGALAAASKLRVGSRSWEVGEADSIHHVAAGGTLRYCATLPATGLTPIIAYSHAPVGKSYTVKLVGPPASGTVPAGDKTRFAKSSGRVSITYATPSFPGHQIAPGTYTFSVLVGGKALASLKLTLTPDASVC